jgi:hypothetical protein
MDIKTVYTCPLGSECKTIKDNVIHQCLWLTGITQIDKKTDETELKEMCAIAWLPVLNIDAANTNRGQTDAICSLRDETMMRQDKAIQAMVEFKENRHARTIEN